mgnify:CR=1 FL=1
MRYNAERDSVIVGNRAGRCHVAEVARKPPGFAFVEFSGSAEANEAIRLFNNQPFKGRPLAVNEARAKEALGHFVARFGERNSAKTMRTRRDRRRVTTRPI